MERPFRGVIAAIPTPLDRDLAPDLAGLALMLDDVVAQGCHGALVLGSTGEGPSFSVAERLAILGAAAEWRARAGREDWLLLAGTGCVSGPETTELSRAAVELQYDAVLLLPPYYFKNVSALGVTRHFANVLEELPEEARVFLYHIPRVTGVAIGFDMLTALRAAFGPMVVGLKDSGMDLAHTAELVDKFPELQLLTGTDSHLLPALAAGATGCITALASACGDVVRAAFDAYEAGIPTAAHQARLEALRTAADRYPLAPVVKELVAARRGLPRWPVRPPLVDLTPAQRDDVVQAVAAAVDGTGEPPS